VNGNAVKSIDNTRAEGIISGFSAIALKQLLPMNLFHKGWTGGQLIRPKGKYFSERELKRILFLLRDSDMSLPEIADRMHRSRSAVAAINRRFQIRIYEGKRNNWKVNGTANHTKFIHL